MVVALPDTHPTCIATKQMVPEEWELYRSRFVVTDEQKRVMEEYHRKIKEQEEKQKR